jgi:hypothetical protein
MSDNNQPDKQIEKEKGNKDGEESEESEANEGSEENENEEEEEEEEEIFNIPIQRDLSDYSHPRKPKPELQPD